MRVLVVFVLFAFLTAVNLYTSASGSRGFCAANVQSCSFDLVCLTLKTPFSLFLTLEKRNKHKHR